MLVPLGQSNLLFGLSFHVKQVGKHAVLHSKNKKETVIVPNQQDNCSIWHICAEIICLNSYSEDSEHIIALKQHSNDLWEWPVLVRWMSVLHLIKSIDHNIILQTFKLVIGIKGTTLSWFKPYLPDGFQFAHVNGEFSTHTSVSHGAPHAAWYY